MGEILCQSHVRIFKGRNRDEICPARRPFPERGRASTQRYNAARTNINTARTIAKTEPYLVWVSVVVVVTGAGTVVCCDVVVVLCVAPSEAQPVIDKSAAAPTQQRMIFFISMIIVWFVNLQCIIAPSAGQRLWGITLTSLSGMADDSPAPWVEDPMATVQRWFILRAFCLPLANVLFGLQFEGVQCLLFILPGWDNSVLSGRVRLPAVCAARRGTVAARRQTAANFYVQFRWRRSAETPLRPCRRPAPCLGCRRGR